MEKLMLVPYSSASIVVSFLVCVIKGTKLRSWQGIPLASFLGIRYPNLDTLSMTRNHQGCQKVCHLHSQPLLFHSIVTLNPFRVMMVKCPWDMLTCWLNSWTTSLKSIQVYPLVTPSSR